MLRRSSTVLAGLAILLTSVAAGCGYARSSTSSSASPPPWWGTPVARSGGVSFYDREAQKVFIYGGVARSGPGAGTSHAPYLSDMWAWDGGGWSAVPLAAADQVPAERVGALTTYDPDQKRILLFGGQALPHEPYIRQLWSWADGRWTRLSDAPIALTVLGGVMAYDAAWHDLVVVTMPPSFHWGTSDPRGVLMDTWLYDGSTWREANPAHRPPFSPTGMVFNSTSHHVLLSDPTRDATQVWRWDGRDWSLTSESIPSDAVLVDGGDLGTLALDQGSPLARPGQPRQVFWLQGGQWSPVGPVTAGPATATAPAYDQHRKQLVAFSDIWSTDQGQMTSDDTWTWTLAAGWTKHTGSTVTKLPVPWITPTQSADYEGHISPGDVREVPLAIGEGETVVLHFRWGHVGDKLQVWQTTQAGTTTPQQWATVLDMSSNHDDSMYLGPSLEGIEGFGQAVHPGAVYLVISDLDSPPNEWWHLTIDRYQGTPSSSP